MKNKKDFYLVKELADKLLKLNGTNGISKTSFLNYQKILIRIRSKLLIGEKFWHKHMYPKPTFDYSKCNGCGICTKKCPLMRIEQINSKPVIKENAPDCIHCGMCVFSCKQGGLYLATDMEKWEKLFIRATLGKGPLVSNEEPKTAAYYSIAK